MRSLVLTLVAAVGGAILMETLKVPAGALVGSMAGVAVVRLLGTSVIPIEGVGRFVLFVSLGWLVGQDMDRDAFKRVISVLPWLIAGVVILVIIGAALAWILWRFGPLNRDTAFLAMAPGALSAMVGIGAHTDANLEIVVVVHVLRIVGVILLAPLILRLVQLLD